MLEGGGLARVQGQRVIPEVGAEGLGIDPAVAPYARLVHQIKRGAVFFGQRRGVLTAKGQMPRRVDPKI